MVEIFQVITQLLIFLLLSYFPFNKFILPKLFKHSNQFYLYYFCLNIIFLIFILLISSLIKVNLETVFKIILIIYLLLLITNFQKTVNEIFDKKNLFLKISFLLVNIFLFINLSYNIELGYDGLQIWLLKTNNFYNGYNYFETFNQLDNVKQYPHLGSYIWAFFWKNSLGDKEYFGRLFHIYIYILSLFILITSIKNYTELKKILILFLLLVFTFDTSLNGYQEYLMFALIILATRFFIIILNFKNNIKYNYKINISSFVIILILICFTKNEGIFYAIFFCIIYYFFNKKKIIPALIILSVAFAITFQIYVSKFLFKVNSVFQFSFAQTLLFNDSLFSIYEIFKRLIYINLYIIHSLFKYPINLINFFGVIISIYCFKKMPENRPFLLFCCLNIFFIFSIYLLTPFPLEWHLQTSIKRLFLQTSGLYFFIVVNILNRKILKF